MPLQQQKSTLYFQGNVAKELKKQRKEKMQEFENKILFHPPPPLPLVENSHFPDLSVRNLWVDGKVHLLIVSPKETDEAKKNLWCLFFHGNGMVVEQCLFLVAPLVRQFKWNLVLVEYRSYGHSVPAVPQLCKESILEDGQLAARYLVETCHVPHGQIVLWGYSLGGAVAAHVASQGPYKCLVLVGAFSSLLDVAKDKGMLNCFTGPLVGLYYACCNKLDTCSMLRRVKIPVILAHALDDSIVPPESFKRNWESITHQNKWVILSQDGTHNFLPTHPWLLEFIQNLQQPEVIDVAPSPASPKTRRQSCLY